MTLQKWYCCVVVLVALTGTMGACTEVKGAEVLVPPAEKILRTLNHTHPRLIIDRGTPGRIKQIIHDDPHAARWYASIRSGAQAILHQTPSKYELPNGRRLRTISARVKDRVRTLAWVYLMEKDRRYADRAWAELQAAAAFHDWNPRHFLDTAEMTHAFAIGYDWLFDAWSDQQRRLLEEAIVNHGLKPALMYYRGEGSGWGWYKSRNNWNQVCNGGIGMGALAIADRHPQLASRVLHEALSSLPLAMQHYAPDGAGTEGVGYWDYGCRYNVLLLASLETALGTDFGLSQIDGFGLSGDYQLFMAGATRMSLNFSDCKLRRMSTPQHFWMGRRFDRPQYSWYRYSELEDPNREAGVLDLLWIDSSAHDFDITSLPLDKHFRRAECASMRSAWNDPNALVVGLQAGQNSRSNHRHLDLGSFILEASGQRWAVDLGSERQTYRRHQHDFERWQFYRIRAEGHNTLVINPDSGPDQDLTAFAKITHFETKPEQTVAMVDLSEAYTGRARRVQRTLSMIRRSQFVVTDRVEADSPADVWWFMHTEADVVLDADETSATLYQRGKRLAMEIVAPASARFTVVKAEPMATSPKPDIQASNDNYHELAIHLTDVNNLELTVKMTPQG